MSADIRDRQEVSVSDQKDAGGGEESRELLPSANKGVGGLACAALNTGGVILISPVAEPAGAIGHQNAGWAARSIVADNCRPTAAAGVESTSGSNSSARRLAQAPTWHLLSQDAFFLSPRTRSPA